MVLLIVFLHSWKFQTFCKNTTIPQTTDKDIFSIIVYKVRGNLSDGYDTFNQGS